MKSRIIFIFLLIHLCFSGYSQKYSTVISDSTILSFLEWEIKNIGISKIPNKKKHQEKIYHKVYNWSESEFIEMDSLEQINQGIMHGFSNYLFGELNKSFFETIIDSSDIKYMVEQYNGLKDKLHWDFNDPSIKIRKNNFRLHKKITYFYSIPIFNQSKDVVLIKKMVYCGKLCAEHAVYIYKKNGPNNWKLVHLANYWVS